jgi:hypothetical protein
VSATPSALPLVPILAIDLVFVFGANLGATVLAALLLRRGRYPKAATVSLALKGLLFASAVYVSVVVPHASLLGLMLDLEAVLAIGYVAFVVDLCVVWEQTRSELRGRARDPYALFMFGLLVIEFVWAAQRIVFVVLASSAPLLLTGP